MRARFFQRPKDITVGDQPDPTIQEPTDPIVRVVMACVYGSDLWYYRGESPHAIGSIGHEFIGFVEDVGADVASLEVGDLVVAPFIYSDMTCRTASTGRRSPVCSAGTSAAARSTAARAKRSGG
jgi:threonine dehydrogenase-like Zn-dependent dehydrogenase